MARIPDKTGSGGVQSLARAFALLECIAQTPGGLGLTELGRRIGLHSSTTFNLARTLVALGYLAQSPEDKRYRIGRNLLCVAANAIDDVYLAEKAKGVMEALSRATGESSTFAVWSGPNVIALARTNGAGAFQLTDRVGAVRPPHATATGRVLLAGLATDRFERYLAHADLARFTPATITDPDELRDEVARVRRTGMALDNAQFHADVCCIAVPVMDFRGTAIGAMGLSGPVERMTVRARSRHAGLLTEAARNLSAELGYGGGQLPASLPPSAGDALRRNAAKPGTRARAPKTPPPTPRKPSRRTTRGGAS